MIDGWDLRDIGDVASNELKLLIVGLFLVKL